MAEPGGVRGAAAFVKRTLDRERLLIRATLSVVLGDAVDDGVIQLKHALGIGRRGRKRPDIIRPADRQKQVRAMTYEQLATFLEVSTARCSHWNVVLLLTLADAGLRPGEACAMRWTDFGPVVSTLLIERTTDNTGRVKTTKTAETRSVDVSARLAAALTDLQASLEAEAMLAGRDGISPWVCQTRAGTPVRPNRVARIFERVLRAAGLPHFRLYDLRHTYASHPIAARAPIDYVAKQLGHSRLTTTLLYYARWFSKGDRRHIEEMERIRGGGKASRLPCPSRRRGPAPRCRSDERGFMPPPWRHD
jgi:integrase